MQQALEAEGYATCNIDYPSTEHEIATLAVDYILPALKTCGGDSYHFITHSMGGILVRYLDYQHQIPNVNRVVMLAPPNRGSELVDELGVLELFDWINGPAGSELGTADTSLVNRLPSPGFAFGVIAGNYSFNPLYSNIIPGEDDGKVAVERTRLAGMQDFLLLPLSHTFIMNDEEVQQQAIFFLQNGRFDQ